MIGKTIMIGICIVTLIAISVVMIEFFIPLSAKAELDNVGRKALLQMEANNGLSETELNQISLELSNLGFSNIKIATSSNMKYGQELSLSIEAIYKYSRLSSILTRENINQLMSFNKTAVARRVTN